MKRHPAQRNVSVCALLVVLQLLAATGSRCQAQGPYPDQYIDQLLRTSDFGVAGIRFSDPEVVRDDRDGASSVSVFYQTPTARSGPTRKYINGFFEVHQYPGLAAMQAGLNRWVALETGWEDLQLADVARVTHSLGNFGGPYSSTTVLAGNGSRLIRVRCKEQGYADADRSRTLAIRLATLINQRLNTTPAAAAPAPAPTPPASPRPSPPPSAAVAPATSDQPQFDQPQLDRPLSPTEAKVAAAVIAAILAAGGIAASVGQSIANAIAQAIQAIADGAGQEIGEAATQGGHGAPPSIVNPYDGTTFETDQDGNFWAPNDNGEWQWMPADKAREAAAAMQREVGKRDEERGDFEAESRRVSDEWMRRKGEEGRQAQEAVERAQAQAEARARAEERTRQGLIEGARKVGEREGGEVQEEVEALLADENYAGLADLYRDRMRDQIRQGVAESANEQAWATAFGTGEMIAQGTVAASRGTLMVIGGPAGMGVTALSVGAISAAQGGADSYVRGDEASEVLKGTAIGFLAGVKDGVIGTYVNVPGTSGAVRVLLPAAGDVTETYIRTGDLQRSLATGAVSAVGDMVGLGMDGMQSGLTRELISGGTAGMSGGTLNVINGGDFGEGFGNGLVNYAGARVGSRIGKAAVDHASAAENQPQLAAHQRQQQGLEAEERVRQAMGETAATRRRTIPTEEQPEIIQQLDNSRHQRVQMDENGKIRVDDNGDPITQDYVNSRQALEQLQDTRSSRTAKQADPELRDSIIRTRAEEVYAPADRRTINRTLEDPEVQGMMRPGDELEMDTFSTPGKPPSLGADRDARLVIKRPTGRVDEDGRPIHERIEVPRRHWEDGAYRDFHDHSMELMGGRGNVTEASHPEFFRRRAELDYLRRAGVSQEDIDARAWGEAHNQLFTDRHHMEASMDNADQTIRPTQGGFERAQQKPSVLRTQEGQQHADGSARNLLDAEGVGRMWGEKSRFYDGNTPEAVAQAQKGIEAHMGVREGLRQQNQEPPPLLDKPAAAMERISRAPVGADATPEAMNQLNSDLQGMGYRDTNEAMQQIASQSEGLKWSRPQGDQTGAPPPLPPPPRPSAEPPPGASIRVAREAMEEPREPDG